MERGAVDRLTFKQSELPKLVDIVDDEERGSVSYVLAPAGRKKLGASLQKVQIAGPVLKETVD